MGFTLNQLEQERQIRKLQKKEDKDTKDYEQLTHLPKINNVELKGNKTTSDLGINADNVMLSDGVTSVEDRVNAHTIDGGFIDISSYIYNNGTYNDYTAPSDGYVVFKYDANSDGGMLVKTDTNNHITMATTKELTQSIFMKKGMQFCFSSIPSIGRFYSFV